MFESYKSLKITARAVTNPLLYEGPWHTFSNGGPRANKCQLWGPRHEIAKFETVHKSILH